MSTLFFWFIIIFGCLYSHKCQIRALEAPAKRVADGYNSVKDRSFYVYIISCYKNVNDKEKSCFGCGGTIISPNEVLTARHCVSKLKHSTLSTEVVFGDFRREKEKQVSRKLAKTIKVGPEQIEFFDITPIIDSASKSKSKKVIYPDLAIIHLGKVKNQMIKERHLSLLRPCPPDFWVSKLGKSVSAVGFGRTEAENVKSIPKVLQEAELEITNTESDCKKQHRWGAYDDQETLCLIGIKCLYAPGEQPKKHYDTDVRLCYGDSGGPIFRTDKDGQGTCLVGVTSVVLNLEVPTSYITSIQKLNEWRKKGDFVSVKKWNDEQECIANGTYPFSERRYKKFLDEYSSKKQSSY